MDALEYRIHDALRAVAAEAYPSRKLPPFEYCIADGEPKTILGYCRYPAPEQGNPVTRIEVFRMYREPRHYILTSIHELAHHCEYSFYRRRGHRIEFYICHCELLAAACRLQIFTQEMLQLLYDGKGDGRGDKKLAKCMKRLTENGEISAEPDLTREYMQDKKLLSVFNAYDSRDIFKSKGFRYNRRSRCWEMIGSEDDIFSWQEILDKSGFEFKVTGVLDVAIIATAIVSGRGTFGCKERLKADGFYYRDGAWSKNFAIEKYSAMEDYLRRLQKAAKPGEIVFGITY